MNYSKDDFKALFQAKFDYNKWFAMLKDFFKADELRTIAEPISDPADCDKGYYIGAINTSDSYRIGLFYYEIGHSNVARKKVGLRNLVRTFINPNWGQFDAALAVFSDGKRWRLSLISDIKGEATAAKRYTFVFGEKDNLYRTAIERFALIRSEGPSFEALKKAFSVEALTEEFFGLYKDHYERFCDFIYQNADDRRYFGPEFALWNSNEDSQKYIRDYVKNLMGRIVFLQFLQKKGWMGVPTDRNDWTGGDPYFMQHLYDNATEEQKEDFLDQVLEPLFFNCLNVLRPNDVFDTNVNGIGTVKVPYLNGELFEQKEVDKAQSKFPKKYFHDLLNLFLQYNFTIDENDPNDAEIGVDPEMLGKIFENLLEDNKDKGAFYTPKEIVRYMCKESLISYLCSNNGAKHTDSIKTLVNNHQLTAKLQKDVKTCERLNKHLRNVKVCDPAIGSGAFPMGLMNEIFACRSVLHENIEETNDETSGQIKREIIQNNIYGVDIEQGAVDIARLRFWLALVVDSVKPEPLPNLDYKIMQGNSLIESYKGLDLSNLLHSDNLFVATKADELGKYMKSYFRATNNEEKRQLRENIDFAVKQCISLSGIHDTITLPNTDFFLWHTYFHDVFKEGGFDIVIGNPPYVLIQKFDDKKLVDYYKRHYSVASYKVDLYHLFIEHGVRILKKGGVISYINPSNFLTNNYTESLRRFLLEKQTLCSVINIEDNVFSASVNTCIIQATKGATDDYTIKYATANIQNSNLNIFTNSTCSNRAYLEEEGEIIQPLGGDNEQLLVKKIKAGSVELGALAKVKFGMQLRNRKIYPNDVIEAPVDSFLSSDYRKCLTGKNIIPYGSEYKGLYCYFNTEAKCGGCWDETVHNTPIKVLVRQVGSTPVCGIDTNGYAVLNSAFMIVCKSTDPYYILALINSTLIKFFWSMVFEDKRKTFPKIKGTYLEKIPVKQPATDVISSLCKTICLKKEQSTDTSDEEQQIDELIYHLYGLTYDEVKIVDPETPITKEEYCKEG